MQLVQNVFRGELLDLGSIEYNLVFRKLKKLMKRGPSSTLPLMILFS